MRAHWWAETCCVFAGMVDNNSARLVVRLGCVPILDGSVHPGLQGGAELEVLSGFFGVVRPVLVTKTDQPLPICWDAAYFFGKTRVSTSSTIWMMLLLRSGDNAIISDAAAKPMAIIAVRTGSIGQQRICSNISCPYLLMLAALAHDHLNVLYDHCVMP